MDVVAFAVYDEVIFSISDIEWSFTGCATSIIEDSKWPVDHALIKASRGTDVAHYRMSTYDIIVDVVAGKNPCATWSQ
jgi:hypothetical protein